MATPFCHLDSNGLETNLQLHALTEANRHWLEVVREVDELPESRIRERCVFVVSALGLSLSQLLGQNVPTGKPRVGPPRQLLASFLSGTRLDERDREDLTARFDDFLDAYDGIRHFGPPKHEIISKLDIQRTRTFVSLTLEIWNVVLAHFRRMNDEEFSGFETIDGLLAYE